MKTIEFHVSFVGRVDDSYAAALQKAWNLSAIEASIPLSEVSLSVQGDKGSWMKFDFCQPQMLFVKETV